MLKNATGDVKNDLEDLMDGKTVISSLNENIVYSENNWKQRKHLKLLC